MSPFYESVVGQSLFTHCLCMSSVSECYQVHTSALVSLVIGK